MISAVRQKRFRRGDIISLCDENNRNRYHPYLIINDDYMRSSECGGHGQLYQTMELSLSKPHKFGIPVVGIDSDVSFIVTNNVYSIHIKDICRGRYVSYIDDDNLIDLAIQLWSISSSKSLNKDYVGNISKIYNQYIDSFIEINGGPILDDYHTKYNSKRKGIVNKEVDNSYNNILISESRMNEIKTLRSRLLNSENIKRVVPRFTKKWEDTDLLLYYILYNNYKKSIEKIYGFNETNIIKRKNSVMTELRSRNLIK